MKRLIILALALCLLLGGCTPLLLEKEKQYTATFLTLFDTVTTIVGRAESEEAFQEKAQKIHDELQVYHRLFDIYNDYEGINNLKTVNENAGLAPVEVDEAVIALLRDCKTYHALTEGKVNVAMGSVLRLWHEARNAGIQDPENAKLPAMEDLRKAAEHTDIESIVIDETAGTVFISDSETSLDVGAVAKGWATQRAALNAPSGMLISVGGNVCATGPKLADGTAWVIGIQDPEQTERNLHTLYVSEGSVVTSGDYQRTYTVDGERYHHIIDPATLMPGDDWRSVSILCDNSGLADALSTALFLIDREAGASLAKDCGAEVLWVNAAGEEFMTPGFESKLRN